MTRQIAPGFRRPSIFVLEERILQLEIRVALLTHAVQGLARELNELAAKEPVSVSGPPDSPDRGTAHT